ncbi:MAG: GFA family protein [Pseudomonadota bacterium]
MSILNYPGRCACGEVRYHLTSTPLIVHACHCRMCQRLSGSSNAINALIEADKVQLLDGKTQDILAATPSGAGQLITRCHTCQVAVWSEYRSFSRRYGARIRFVRAGTLDQPETFPPDVHIFTESMQPHRQPSDGKPQFPAFYDVKKVWTSGNQHRLQQAKARHTQA